MVNMAVNLKLGWVTTVGSTNMVNMAVNLKLGWVTD
jgi:hypothetical protein